MSRVSFLILILCKLIGTLMSLVRLLLLDLRWWLKLVALLLCGLRITMMRCVVFFAMVRCRLRVCFIISRCMIGRRVMVSFTLRTVSPVSVVFVLLSRRSLVRLVLFTLTRVRSRVRPRRLTPCGTIRRT